MKKTTLTKISKSIIATTLFLFCIGFSYGQSTTSNSKTSICPYCGQTIQIIGSTTVTPASGVIHNPLYEPIQTGGNNPLYESSNTTYGGKKGYDYFQAIGAMSSGGVQNNPCYKANSNTGEMPDSLFE